MAGKYMIVAGASVVVVREGKRKTIAPGGGTSFTEDEITEINAAAPGALRAPINEGRAVDTGVDADGDEIAAPAKPAKATGKGKGKAKAAKPAAETPADADDEDEDEDI